MRFVGADMGVAYDGDADRCLAVDAQGNLVDGDQIMGLLAVGMKEDGTLASDTLVVTVMSNLGLLLAMRERGIRVVQTGVGDRYVLEAMRRSRARLGGEQSGHIIADAFTRTGDGLCTALLLLNALKDLGEDVDTLVDRFGRYPQKLSNLTLAPGCRLDMERVGEIAEEVQQGMCGRGRVLVRPSGTEPLLRILVEARDEPLVDEVFERLIARLKAYC